MLIGEYNYSIDAKKRLAIPSKLRKEFSEGLIITRGLDSCLFLFPKNEWQKFVDKLSALPLGQSDIRNFVRFMLSGAQEVELDGLGRILIPDYLKNYATLNKKIVVIGALNRLEIWDDSKWNQYKNNIEKDGDKIAEKLGELGMI